MAVGQDLKLISIKPAHRFRRGSKRPPDKLIAIKICRAIKLFWIKSRGARPCNLPVSSLTGAILDTEERLKLRNKRNLQCPMPRRTLIPVKY